MFVFLLYSLKFPSFYVLIVVIDYILAGRYGGYKGKVISQHNVVAAIVNE